LLRNKKRLVLHDVVQHLHWLLTRELLHQIVRSGKDSITTILGNGRYMLPDVGGVSHLLPDFTKGFDLDRNVGNFSSEDLREDVSHFVLRQFLRTIKGISLSSVLLGVIQDRGNDPALIFRRDRSITSVAKGKRKHIFLPDAFRYIHEPFGKEGGPQMS